MLLAVMEPESLILSSAAVDALESVMLDRLEMGVACRWHTQSDCRGIQFACCMKARDAATGDTRCSDDVNTASGRHEYRIRGQWAVGGGWWVDGWVVGGR